MISAAKSEHIDPRQASLERQGITHEKLQRYLQRKLSQQAPRTPSSLSLASTSTELNLDDCFNSRPPTRGSTGNSNHSQEKPKASTPRNEGTYSGGRSRRSSDDSAGGSRSQAESRNEGKGSSRRKSQQVTLPGTPEPLDTRQKTMKVRNHWNDLFIQLPFSC